MMARQRRMRAHVELGFPAFANIASRIKIGYGPPLDRRGRSPYVSMITRFCAADGAGVSSMHNANSGRGIFIGFAFRRKL